MRVIWNELSAGIIRNCWKHTELLKEHDEATSLIDLTTTEPVTADEERQEIENALAELVPNRVRMTVGEFLEVGEDENSIDVVCAEDTVASLSDDVYNSLERNQDSADEANSGMEETIPEFSTKEALKALGIVSTVLDESNPDQRSALRVISQIQRELRKKRIGEYRQANIQSYFAK